ncbi:MAG: UDP-N-acetylmuramoyl-L-alanine--D-glutamate ligase [Bacteroidota bacterium]|nr:UDP-N-acetylmuramoyl-L-alanine--D-glutamate ligase [Bacteroidota bacterium]
MIDCIRRKLENRKVLLLGFGREGKSSYKLIRKVLPALPVAIADSNTNICKDPLVAGDPLVSFRVGEIYLNGLNEFDVIFKSPGITLKDLPEGTDLSRVTSQTDLFMEIFSSQVVGITGTKGKSTTSTLVHHLLRQAGKPSVLLGNIGRPAFEALEDITPETTIVYELSSHQLEHVSYAPHIAVFLNLFPEHLDAYHSFRDYMLAKMNITRCQSEQDFLIYNRDDERVRSLINEFSLLRRYFPFSFSEEQKNGAYIKDGWIWFSKDGLAQPVINLQQKIHLKGDHNLKNIMAAISACKILDVSNDDISDGVASFRGLEHRIEFAGIHRGIYFYNDSIATVPEACMEAVKALGNVDTLILGGFDRGIDYSGLASFLARSDVRNFILTGEAGKRIGKELLKCKREEQVLYPVAKFDDFLPIAITQTHPGFTCLLSPAASSYDEFMNFEVRGKRFKELVGMTGNENE